MTNTNPCFCISVRTGSLLVAVLEIVLSVVFGGFNVFALVAFLSLHVKHGHDAATMQAISNQINQQNPGFQMNDSKPEAVFGLIYALLGLNCLICTLKVIFGGLLIRGIQQERLKLLKLWLIFKVSCLVFTILFTISTVILEGRQGSLGTTIINVILTLLGLYYVFVVCQLYKDIRTRNQQPCKPKSKDASQHVNYA